MRILKRLLLILFLVLLPTWCFAQENGGTDQLDALVNEAVANNPELKSAEARWEAFTQKARQAGVWEDPMVMVKIQNALIRDPLDFKRDPMTAKVIGISQTLPFYGKRSLQREAAGQAAEGERWSFEERKLELRRMVKETWYQLYFADRSLEIVERNIDILDELTRFTETMYGVGQGLQQDVLKAQVERSKMEDMRISLTQQRRSLEAGLNVLLYRPVGTPVPRFEVHLTPVDLENAELERLADENRPLIRSLSTQVKKAQVSRRLAQKEFYPDFTLSLEYMQREPTMMEEGYDMYGAGITFNLPVQRERRHAMVAEAESETRMAQEELNMLRNEIRFSIADAAARLERSRKLAQLYRDGILPQAGHSLEAAMSAYRVGKADFMNVLDSQMALFNFEREYYDAVAEHQMQLAVLEGVVGSELPPRPTEADHAPSSGKKEVE